MRFATSSFCAALLLVAGCSGSSTPSDRSAQRTSAAPARPATVAPPARPATAPPAQPAATGARAIGSFTTKSGMAFTNSFGNTLTVTNVWGHHIEFRDQSGKEYLSYALLYSPDPKLQGSEHVMQAIDSLWPLAEGKTASAWVYNAEWAWKLSWQVVGRETVQVPAGRFDTWLIEHTEESLQGEFVGKTRSWYAPAVGWNVRYRSWQERPSTTKKPEEWVLTSAPSTTAAR